MFNKFSIDYHSVVWNGSLYLFYSVDDWLGSDYHRPGTCVLLDKMIDPETLEGNLVAVALPTMYEEIFTHNRFGDNRNWHTVEGACLIEGNEKSFLLYSANRFTDVNYFVGYYVAENKHDLRDMVWKKHTNNGTWAPLLSRSETLEGTGHNTVAFAPDLVHSWMIYHARLASEAIVKGTEQREMHIAPIEICGDVLHMASPTLNAQPSPLQPLFSIEKHSITSQPYWAVCPLPKNARLRLWICANPVHTGARYGILLREIDKQNVFEVQINSGQNTATIIETVKGLKQIIANIPLPIGYNHFVPRLIVANCCFNNWELNIDDLSTCFNTRISDGSLSFATYYTHITITGLKVASHFSLQEKELKNLSNWTLLSPCYLDDIGLHGTPQFTLQLQNTSGSEECFFFSDCGSINISHNDTTLYSLTLTANNCFLRCTQNNTTTSFYINGKLAYSAHNKKSLYLAINNTHVKQYIYTKLY